MVTSIDVKFTFDSARLGVVQFRKYSPNSRCGPSSCAFAVLAMFLAIISPSSYSWNEWNVRHFLFSQPKQLNLVPRSSRLTMP